MKISKYICLAFLLILNMKFYAAGEPAERVYVHTDRNIYVAGEDLLYSFFLLTGEWPVPDGSSTVGYLELINSNNHAVAQTRFFINEGYNHGILSIPDSLSTGDYMLRAYTRQMRNYGTEAFFTQLLVIYNPFKENTISGHPDTTGINTYKQIFSELSSNINRTDNTGNTFQTRKKITMRFQVDSSLFADPEKCAISIAVAVKPANRRLGTICNHLLGDINHNDEIQELNHPSIMKENIGPYLEG
ncbi:MAG TPA: hypothetical protein DEQ09_11230, partial [Bacteroidales bacterium]|nr:hypothetical protein [Bacteroidales bacterium]